MNPNDSATTREGFTPEGCIATVPPQGVRSCELVIATLAHELARVHALLGCAIEIYVHRWNTPDDVRDACEYTQGWRQACRLLAELREDWPHLDV